MKTKLDFKSKRTIIIIDIILVLALGAGIGGYFYAKGNNRSRATDISKINQTATEQSPTGDNIQETPNINTNNGETGANGTASTNTTENIVVGEPWESYSVNWVPQYLSVSTPEVNVSKSNIYVEKTAQTSTGYNSVSGKDTITYTITVTNNNSEVLNSLYISDKIPEQTTFDSAKKDGKTIEENNVVTKVYWNLWNLGINPGEKYSVSFNVTINNGAKGTIKNKAIVEENESNETTVILSTDNKIFIEEDEDEPKSKAEKEPEKDKTATNLDKNFESTVTLSIPREEKNKTYDVVFVLDKSASANDRVTRVISEYVDTISNNRAIIKTGVVSFYNKAVPVKRLSTDKINPSSLTVSGSGTNLAGGILLGTQMLDEDNTVSANHKFLIVISDGDTHVFNKNNDLSGIPIVVLDKSNNNYQAGPGAYLRKYGNYNPPSNWDNYFKEIKKLVENDGDSYQTPWAHSSNRYNNEVRNGTANGYIPEENLDEHACTVDTALYYANVNFKSAKNKGYNTYAVRIESSYDRFYGPSFMDYLNGGDRLDLGELVKTVYYVYAGSYVTDKIGEGRDSEGNYYNFDFVDDLEKIDIVLNENKLSKKEDKDGKYYAFGEKVEDKNGNKVYPFTLRYNKEDDSFVWNFNIDLTIYDKVKLVYKAKLTNPQKEPGEYNNLKTNKKATITTKDGEFEFPRPKVSYKVETY